MIRILQVIGGAMALAASPMLAEPLQTPRTTSHAAARRMRPASIDMSARIDEANRNALREPEAAGYVNATQVYPFSEGALFRLYAAPGLVSDIALQPGETLVSVAAGDTVRWVISNTSSGSGPGKRTHILVKPSASDLRTNLVIATDRRVYLVMMDSRLGSSMAAVSWSYPADELLALKASQAAASEAAPVAEGVAVDALNFNFSIEGDRPAWRPIRAFDDGRQVFIEFPPDASEAPPLFVIGSSGKPELVNYRVRGRYYVVDRLFSVAELRLGEKHQQVVRIVRTDGRHPGRA
jgi:P-type conjugative transfer protein TrbG